MSPATAALLAGVNVLLVEEDELATQFVTVLLHAHGADVHTVRSDVAALAEIRTNPRWAGVLLCDLNLPDQGGLAVIEEALRRVPSIAAILMTSEDDPEIAAKVIDLGGFGYLTKPMRATDLVFTVRSGAHRRELALVAEADAARRELTLQEETIRCLTGAAELRDVDTGQHIERMSAYLEVIATEMGLAPERVSLLKTASPMHDIGKIGISDSVLLKPGRLTAEEREEMERHAEIGYSMLKDSDSALLQLGALLALTHHERFDGTGYPRGLAGEQIPIEGRIAAVADVFDALTSDRVYRDALSIEDAVATMLEERGKHFDPYVLDTFIEHIDEVLRVRARLTPPAPPLRRSGAVRQLALHRGLDPCRPARSSA